MSKGEKRRARVAHTMRLHLSEMISRELKDPRLEGVPVISVNIVELNGDMSTARVFVGFPGAEPAAAEQAVRALETGGRRLRGPLARRMNLARAPALRFELDTSQEFGAWLTEVVREDEARTRDDGEPDSSAEAGPGADGGADEDKGATGGAGGRSPGGAGGGTPPSGSGDQA